MKRLAFLTPLAFVTVTLLAGCGTPAQAAKPAITPIAVTVTKQLASEAITDWYAEGGQERLQAVADSGNALGQAQGVYQTIGACKLLQTSVEAVQAFRPLPTPATQEPVAQAMASFSRFASACIDSIQTNSYVLLDQAKQDEADAEIALKQAIVEINTALSEQ